MIRFLVLLVGALALVGCSTPTPPPQFQDHGQHHGGEQVTPGVPPEVPLPARLSIPKIGAESSLVAVGLVDGEIDIPPATEPMQAAWWDGSPRPGADGPAVLLGHVDGQINGRAGQPGVFNQLRELAPGDDVIVTRDDGSEVRFTVYTVETHPKAALERGSPEYNGDLARKVYGNTDEPELRAMTCGGSFDRSARSYRDSVIVWAKIAS